MVNVRELRQRHRKVWVGENRWRVSGNMSLSLHSHLSLPQADLLEAGIVTTRCLAVTGGGNVAKCSRFHFTSPAGFQCTLNIVITYWVSLLDNVEINNLYQTMCYVTLRRCWNIGPIWISNNNNIIIQTFLSRNEVITSEAVAAQGRSCHYCPLLWARWNKWVLSLDFKTVSQVLSRTVLEKIKKIT